MSLNKDALKLAIKQAFTAEQTEELDPAASVERLAEKLSTAMDLFVKSGTVTTTVTVSTTGTETYHTGGGSGTGNIT